MRPIASADTNSNDPTDFKSAMRKKNHAKTQSKKIKEVTRKSGTGRSWQAMTHAIFLSLSSVPPLRLCAFA
jgi:hypothetical protein